MAQEKHLSSHLTAHGSGACCCDYGTRVCTELASFVEWAYETAIVGGICENVGKFSALLSRSCTRVVQSTWDSVETHGALPTVSLQRKRERAPRHDMSQQLKNRKRVGKGTHESADLSDERERSRNTALWTGTDRDVCSNDCASTAVRISTCGELENVDSPEGFYVAGTKLASVRGGKHL